ncbi:TerB family tellurite resistance protein [Burkholderia gladioli]|uniref:tellurite resistance TerB family protein n=1 Tax=Burkholderia gladioli TaxID=28095 RepID=UPI00163E9B80|nr:TerB family tellurite resistance protein [Burkholderia gladioli]
MRSYPRNSPQAAARIVALVLIADGHIDRREEQVIETLGIARKLGLGTAEFERIVQALCEDQALGQASSGTLSAVLDPASLKPLLAEIDDPKLRKRTIEQCLAVASADRHLADAEIVVLAAILDAWRPRPH